MTTLNISLPESMRKFVEAQAENGDFTTSEYVRHIIRKEQEQTLERRARIEEYLAYCQKQIDEGKISTLGRDEMLIKFKREYKKRRAKRSKK